MHWGEKRLPINCIVVQKPKARNDASSLQPNQVSTPYVSPPGASLIQLLQCISPLWGGRFGVVPSLIRGWKRHKEDCRAKWTINRAVLPTNDAAADSAESAGFRWLRSRYERWVIWHSIAKQAVRSGVVKKDSWTIVYENVTKSSRACPLFCLGAAEMGRGSNWETCAT